MMELSNGIHTGDQLRNYNSYDYLSRFYEAIQNIKRAEGLSKGLREVIADYEKFFGHEDKPQEYQRDRAYGDLYTRFLAGLQTSLPKDYARKLNDKKNAQGQVLIDAVISQIDKKKQPEYSGIAKQQPIQKAEHEAKLGQAEHDLAALNQLIKLIYVNNNQALETAATMIEDLVGRTIQTEHQIETAVTQLLDNDPQPVNKTTPQAEGSVLGRLKATLASTYQPMLTTSLPQLRTYRHTEQLDSVEFRTGTQGERIDGEVRVNPLFELYIEQQEEPQLTAEDKKITHIYFNNLGLDRDDYEGKKEKAFSDALHAMEEKHPNLAVITLPADKGIMAKSFLNHGRKYPVKEAKEIFNAIASAKKDRERIQAIPDDRRDFYLSDNVKNLLKEAGGYDSYEEMVNDLVNQAFKEMGYDGHKEPLSSAELQAVFFHFSKSTFTNYCIDKLKPESFNMSCKDAIDRGGVSSAYYNLMKSIELKTPMSKEEFHRALHAAPTMVKGRGMNHHAKLIWNALDRYINDENNYENAPEWLSEWVFENAPKDKAKDCLVRHIDKMLNELTGFKGEVADEAVNALKETKALLDSNPNSKAYGLVYQTALQMKNLVMKTHALNAEPENQEKVDAFRLAYERFNTSYHKAEKHYNGFFKKMAKFFERIGRVFSKAIENKYSNHQKAENIRNKQRDFKEKICHKTPGTDKNEIKTIEDTPHHQR